MNLLGWRTGWDIVGSMGGINTVMSPEIPGYRPRRVVVEVKRDFWSWTSHGTAVSLPDTAHDADGRLHAEITLHIGWWWTPAELRVLFAHELGHVLQRDNDPIDPMTRRGDDHGRRHRHATQVALAWIVPEVHKLGPFWASAANQATRPSALNPWDNRRDTPSHAHDTALVELLGRIPPTTRPAVRS